MLYFETLGSNYMYFILFLFISERDDCVALYSGGNANENWETVTCFEERAYICEIPEGQDLATGPAGSGTSIDLMNHQVFCIFCCLQLSVEINWSCLQMFDRLLPRAFNSFQAFLKLVFGEGNSL